MLQNFMFNMLKDNNSKAAKMSLGVMIELYKKNIWNDAKTVNVIAVACFSKIVKVKKKTIFIVKTKCQNIKALQVILLGHGSSFKFFFGFR